MAALATTLVTASKDARPSRYLYFLHGILGSRANWRSIARKLAEAQPDWGMVLVDLRRHGESQAVDGEDTVAQAAADVLQAADALERPIAAVLGHSFGGKVALELLAQTAGQDTDAPRHVFVVDAMPGLWSSGNDPGTPEVLAALEDFPREHPSRTAFIDGFVDRGFTRSLAQWLAMNLERREDGVRLGLDLAAIRRLLEDYQGRDLWPTVAKPPANTTVHLVIAGASVAYDAKARARAESLTTQAEPGRVRA